MGGLYSAMEHQKNPFVEVRARVEKPNAVNLWFSRFAAKTAVLVGRPYMFFLAVAVIVAWAILRPHFCFFDTWQLILNTRAKIFTFLFFFLIQNTPKRDSQNLHLKLDELIRSHHPASNELIDVEKLSDEELDALEERYAGIRREREARRK